MEGIRGDRRSKRPHTRASRRLAVERAEAYLLAHADATVTIAQLCRIVGLRERTLRNAFYDLHGVSPKRYTIRLRLYGVRRELRGAVGRQTTVTSIASQYGFFDLGRFAGAYKAMFGEVPSATLRCAISNRFDTRLLLQENANARACSYQHHD
jgi:AraC family transcriptional regulator, ethanolamine operon transcriptional activator